MRHLWNIEHITTLTGRLSEILEGGRDWFPTVFLPVYEFELEILRTRESAFCEDTARALQG